MIAGVAGQEVTKHFCGVSIDKKNNSFHNLALPLFVFSMTKPPKENKDIE